MTVYQGCVVDKKLINILNNIMNNILNNNLNNIMNNNLNNNLNNKLLELKNKTLDVQDGLYWIYSTKSYRIELVIMLTCKCLTVFTKNHQTTIDLLLF